MDIDTALDEVFALPLDRFTKERNRIASELADAGDDEGAAQIRSIKKPTLSVWAVNQLARHAPEDIAALAALHERIAGAGGGKELRDLTDERRRLIAGLGDRAAAILEEGGHSATSATLQKVSQTLLAASAEEDLEALSKGRLSADVSSPGFGALSGFEAAAGSSPYERVDRRARDKAENLDRRASEAERSAADARRAADHAAEEARRLSELADKEERRAEQARAKATEALEKLG